MISSSERLERGGMYLLIMMPVYGFITHFFLAWQLLNVGCLTALTIVGCFVTFLPKHLGTYSETEVIRYEGGINKGADPNPDRESRHETIREGRRLPLRAPACIVLLALSVIALILIPAEAYNDQSGLYRFCFIGLTAVFEIICMASITQEFCVWTQLPGIGLGFMGYLVAALYFYISKSEGGVFFTSLGISALIFLFGAFVCLNRASISSETSDAEGRKALKTIEKRNRIVVLIFAAVIALISFVKPVRDAALWVVRWIAVFFSYLAWLLRGGKDVDKGDLNRLLEMQGFGEEVPEEEIEAIQEELEQLESTTMDKVIVFTFIGLIALGLLFIIYSAAMRKVKRDGYLFRRRRVAASEGYYDEKQSLESDEVRKKYAKNRLKNLFKRETPWEKLDGREKARRLIKRLYEKRLKNAEKLETKTVTQALEMTALKPDTALRTREAYDKARYSEHEVDGEKMDELRKELKL